MASSCLGPALARADRTSGPHIQFPTEPHERIAVSSYPFRNFMSGQTNGGRSVDLKDFPALVVERFQIHKIEPWSKHFTSVDPKYLEELRMALDKAKSTVVNIPVDSDLNPFAANGSERERGIAFNKKWVDVAVAIGSPSIRPGLGHARDPETSLERVAESTARLVEYASTKNIVVTLENDSIKSSDPFFVVKVIQKVNSPWLRALPDFGNTLAATAPDYAYRGLDAMFQHAYCITHVKSSETNGKGITVHVDMAKAFGILKRNNYKGYCSMEWDDRGDPFVETEKLIKTTLRYL
ncbi:MAG: sugar phosphate isomerase/epimerase family protein [Acidobacteriaceae bacterium]